MDSPRPLVKTKIPAWPALSGACTRRGMEEPLPAWVQDNGSEDCGREV